MIRERERFALEHALRAVAEQVAAAGTIVEDALAAGADSVALIAKMLRLELLHVKADLERELARLVLDCADCGRTVHLVSGVGAEAGHWAHREPAPHHRPCSTEPPCRRRCISVREPRRGFMRALFVGIVGMLLLAVGGPAGAKWMFDAADISGPGLGPADLRISGPATEGLWNAGIDVADGMDDTRPDSIADLGLTASELGPRYVAMYRLETGTAAAEIVRQELYPYADGGPVTYTPPGQRIADGLSWGGAISAGWYRNPPAFFQYLVDQGLPRTEPMTAPPARDSASGSPAAARSTPWGLFALAVGGLVALSVAAISSWSTASRV